MRLDLLHFDWLNVVLVVVLFACPLAVVGMPLWLPVAARVDVVALPPDAP